MKRFIFTALTTLALPPDSAATGVPYLLGLLGSSGDAAYYTVISY
jgi:hypothetical protein